MGRLVLTHSTYLEGLIPFLKKLVTIEGIGTVSPGVINKVKGKSPNLQIKITTKTTGGYKMIARKGRTSQEVFVITKKNKKELTQIVSEITD